MTEEEAVKAVIAAWRIEGVNPKYHAFMKGELRRKWPVLFQALTQLDRVKK